MRRFIDLLAIYTSSGGAPSSGGHLIGVLRERQLCRVYIGLNGIYLCSEYTRGGMGPPWSFEYHSNLRPGKYQSTSQAPGLIPRFVSRILSYFELPDGSSARKFNSRDPYTPRSPPGNLQSLDPTVPLRSATSQDLAIVRFQISSQPRLGCPRFTCTLLQAPVNMITMPVHNGDIVALKDREQQGWWCPTPFFKLVPILLYDDDTPSSEDRDVEWRTATHSDNLNSAL